MRRNLFIPRSRLDFLRFLRFQIFLSSNLVRCFHNLHNVYLRFAVQSCDFTKGEKNRKKNWKRMNTWDNGKERQRKCNKNLLENAKDERRNVLERQEHKVKYNNNNLYDLRKIFTYHLQQNSRSYSSFRSEFSSALHSLSHKSQFNFEFILIINKVRASEFVEIAFFIRKRKYKTENKKWTRNSCHSCIFYLKLPFRCFCTEEDRNDL